jgi:hypothetical protein
VAEESLFAQAVIRAFAVEHLGAAAFRTRNEALTRSAMKAGLWSAFVERFTGAGILFEQIFVLCLSLWLVCKCWPHSWAVRCSTLWSICRYS